MSVWLQLVGAVLVLLPFAWAQIGSLKPDTVAYLWPNLVGSSMLAVLALLGSQWGFVLLESCWALATAWSLYTRRSLHSRRSSEELGGL